MNVLVFSGSIIKRSQLKHKQNAYALEFTVNSDVGTRERKSFQLIDCSCESPELASIEKYLMEGAVVGVSGETTIKEKKTPNGRKIPFLSVRVIDLEVLSHPLPDLLRGALSARN